MNWFCFLLLVNCVNSVNFTENIYLKTKNKIIKKDISLWSGSEKNIFLESNKKNILQEVFDHIPRPVAKYILLEIDGDKTLDYILNKYDIEISKKIKNMVLISLKESFHFSSIVNEIESIQGVKSINFFDHIPLTNPEPEKKTDNMEKNKRKLTETTNYPNDPAYDQYQKKIYISISHPMTKTRNYSDGSDSTVTILDDSIDLNHADLDNYKINVLEQHIPFAAWNSIYTHGTRVVGIIGAKTNNNKDIAGASSGSKINFISFYDCFYNNCEMRGLSELFINIILTNNYEDRRSIVSNSWGSISFVGSPYWNSNRMYIEESVKTFRNGSGGILVFSAGNGRMQNNYAHYSLANTMLNTITVGSFLVGDATNEASYFSEECSCLTVSAPGEDIYSLWPGNYISSSSGTSFAAPFVSSAISMLLQKRPDLRNVDVVSLLMKSASKNINETFTYNSKGFGYSNRLGAGILNITNLMKMSEKWEKLEPYLIENVGNNNMGIKEIKNGESIDYEFYIDCDETVQAQSVQINLIAHFNWYQNFKLEVISPSGTISEIINFHDPYGPTTDEYGIQSNHIQDYYKRRSSGYNTVPWFYTNYAFKTNQFLDENVKGTWKIKVSHGGYLDTCNDSCSHSNNNVCDDLYTSENTPLCSVGTDCTDCTTSQFLGSAFRYPYLNDTIHDVKININGFYNSKPEISHNEFEECNSQSILENSPYEKCSEKALSELYYFGRDYMCACLDHYQSSTDSNCKISLSQTFKNGEEALSNQYITLNDVLTTCGTRDIKVNMNSISESQEKCCGENCVVELDSSHYSVIYKSNIQKYYENCLYWCRSEILDQNKRCKDTSCNGCPECHGIELS